MPVKLKPVVKNLEGIPDHFHELYEKDGDQFVLIGVDEKDYKTNLGEFRNNNIALKKEQERLNKELEKFKDIDPEQYAAALEAKKKLDERDDTDLLKGGKVDELLAKRTETMRQDYEKRLIAAQNTNKKNEEAATKYRAGLRALKVEQAITTAVQKAGAVRPGAMPDIINRAKSVWDLDDNDELVGKDLYNDKGEAMDVDQWAQRLVTDAAHFFEPAQGGGAKGGQKQTGAPGTIRTLHNPDPHTFGKNLDAIASGKLNVTMEGTHG